MSQLDKTTVAGDDVGRQLSRLEVVGGAEVHKPHISLENQHLGHLQGIWNDFQRQQLLIDSLQAEKETLAAQNERYRDKIDALQIEKENLQHKIQNHLETIKSLQSDKESLRRAAQNQREHIRSLQSERESLRKKDQAHCENIKLLQADIESLRSFRAGPEPDDADLYRQSPGGIYCPHMRLVEAVNEYIDRESFVFTPTQLAREEEWLKDIEQLHELRQGKYPLGIEAKRAEREILKRFSTKYTRHDLMDIIVLKETCLNNALATAADANWKAKIQNDAQLQSEASKLQLQARLIEETSKKESALAKVEDVKSKLSQAKQSLQAESRMLELSQTNNSKLVAIVERMESKIQKLKMLEVDNTKLTATLEERDDTIKQLRNNNEPYRELSFAIVDRIRELDKPIDERNDTVISKGNVAAHGGNILVATERYTNCDEKDAEWFEDNYGFKIESFHRVKKCPMLQEIVDMRFQMKHCVKSIPNYDSTKFEKVFQEVKKQIKEWDDEVLVERTTEVISAEMDKNLLEDKDTMDKVQILRDEHDIAVKNEKVARARIQGIRKAREARAG